ncbi:uncharacterized protein LOC122667011 [Telopea speciosissima]|uniref:uncharacterized protein LOC122667011 n=1 Tax=Telopea speciosissima TaxID=54955 RepID=UPI001CC5CEC3|nr:uncharacterized protein LOC122667011 [Telopea speciosissima]
MGENEWITDAMTDDWLVVEVLMRLRQPEEHASLPTKRLVSVLPEWGLRQPRSRQILRCSSVQVKKDGESRRASPTTPLSWSGGTSFSGSGAVDGYEECSHPVKGSSGVRSKVISTSVTAGRRSRKKKTFAELKEEESLLLKESINLKKELETLRADFEEQRAKNETFKRMKLDLQLQSGKDAATSVDLMDAADCEVPDQTEANSVDYSHLNFPKHDECDERDAVACPSSDSDSRRIEEKDASALMANNFFVLPDLNLPLEEDSNSELLYGLS